uniref:RING-type E3 ubiquitin transferase n=1 Tax=Malurus cyaneus samueli TaxID=2593467 RepID=A0A8C5XAA2_9PASS
MGDFLCSSRCSSPFNDRPICRICHEGSSHEELLSPCECTGTLGTIHRSCLEHWLSSSNTSYCELCHFRFAVERKTDCWEVGQGESSSRLPKLLHVGLRWECTFCV